MKRMIGIGGGLLALVAIAVFFLYSSLDTIITSAVEKFGSEITQTRVHPEGNKNFASPMARGPCADSE